MFPILYESEHLSIQTLWIFVVIALLTGSYLAVKRLKRRRVNFTLFIEHSTSMLISGLLGARLVYFFTHTNAYFPGLDWRTLWNFISIWDQGLSFWGGVIGVILMLSYRVWKAKENLWKWYDALIVPGMVGMMIGNLGAFLGGYAYGIPTKLPWGVQYEVFHVRYTTPVHPTQIYAILFLGALLWSKQQLKQKTEFFKVDGNTTLYLSSVGSFGYFLLEFLRGDDTLLIANFRVPIFLFFLVAVITGTLLYRRYKQFKQSSNEQD